MEKVTYINISPSEFNEDKLIIEDAITISYVIGAATVDVTSSKIFYENEDGDKAEFYTPAPSQRVYGVNYKYPFASAEIDHIPEKAEGMQIGYPITSKDTINKPTDEEIAFKIMIDKIWNKVVEKGKSECDKDKPVVPNPTISSFIAAEKKGMWHNAVKVPYDFPNSKDGKTKDKTKPQRMYIDLITSGKGNNLKSASQFYGPGDVPVNPKQFIDAPGIIEPALKVDSVFWGAHGPKAPYGASIKFKVAQANFSPSSVFNVPKERLIGRNTSPIEEAEEKSKASKEDHSSEAEGFQNGNTNQKEMLKKMSQKPKTIAKPTINTVKTSKSENTENNIETKPTSKPNKPQIKITKQILKPKAKAILKPKEESEEEEEEEEEEE